MSLELPAAIENLASIKEKAVKVLTMAGIEHLTALNIDLPALFQRNEDILDEVRVNELPENFIMKLSLEGNVPEMILYPCLLQYYNIVMIRTHVITKWVITDYLVFMDNNM